MSVRRPPPLLAALVVVIAVGGAGCLPPLTAPAGARVACVANVDCPAGLACDVDRGRCLPRDGACTEADGASVSAVVDGAPCPLAAGDGLCIAGFCGASTCGDGFVDVDADEECDLGDANDDDEPGRCRTDCRSPRCGDGVVDIDEGCDDDENVDCRDCQLVCQVGRSDCNGRGGCECVPEPLDVELGRVFAMAADADAVYLMATADGPGLSLLRVGFDGGSEVLGDDFDTFGGVILVDDHVVFAGGGAVTAVPVDGGPARTLLPGFFFDIAADGEGVVTFSDEDDTRRVGLDGGVEVIGPPIPACASGAVIDGVAYASNDLGEIVRVDADRLVVLADGRFEIGGVELASDGRALWWLDERGDLYRLDPAADDPVAIRVARLPSTLAGSRPFDLQVDDRGYAWRAEVLRGFDSDDMVVTGEPPTGAGVRARPGSVVDTMAIGPSALCFSSFDAVFCLER